MSKDRRKVPDRVARVQGIRRSGASGKHTNRRDVKHNTRQTRKARAVKESQDSE